MRLLGAPADYPAPVFEELRKNAANGRSFFLWSDGEDLTAVVADEGDLPADVQRIVQRHVPEFAA